MSFDHFARTIFEFSSSPGTSRCFQRAISVQEVEGLWAPIEEHYTAVHRAYHTLQHLKEMVNLFDLHKDSLTEIDKLVIYFSIFYHDIIYDPQSKTNEEDSAEFMKQAQSPFLSEEYIEIIAFYILCTKSHKINEEEVSKRGINLRSLSVFLDIDLSILGSPRDRYREYMSQIRREYCSFNDQQYFEGRLKVLQYFLSMERIYHSDALHQQLDHTARENLQFEIDTLLSGQR